MIVYYGCLSHMLFNSWNIFAYWALYGKRRALQQNLTQTEIVYIYAAADVIC